MRKTKEVCDLMELGSAKGWNDIGELGSGVPSRRIVLDLVLLIGILFGFLLVSLFLFGIFLFLK